MYDNMQMKLNFDNAVIDYFSEYRYLKMRRRIKEKKVLCSWNYVRLRSFVFRVMVYVWQTIDLFWFGRDLSKFTFSQPQWHTMKMFNGIHWGALCQFYWMFSCILFMYYYFYQSNNSFAVCGRHWDWSSTLNRKHI